MQLSTILAWGLATIASASPVEKRDLSCKADNNSGYMTYEIYGAFPENEAAGVCGGLWDNLNGWPCSATITTCGVENSGGFRWKFNAPIGCNEGMVQSVWWEATKNKWGAIDC